MPGCWDTYCDDGGRVFGDGGDAAFLHDDLGLEGHVGRQILEDVHILLELLLREQLLKLGC